MHWKLSWAFAMPHGQTELVSLPSLCISWLFSIPSTSQQSWPARRSTARTSEVCLKNITMLLGFISPVIWKLPKTFLYGWKEEMLLLIFNEKLSQIDAGLVRYVQNCLVYQIIETRFVAVNRSHNNRSKWFMTLVRKSYYKNQRFLRKDFLKQI